jgi:very-long-chain (3R)-3-hydroxyacyl-CoA dehydratase
MPTFFQVTMRAFVFIAVCDHYKPVQTSFQFPTMVLVWNMSEVIRYSYYATNLMGIPFQVLTWLRYTLFIVLYPIGACSEVLCMFAALPDIKNDHDRNITMPNELNATFNFYYFIIILMLLYIPGFPPMYGHMLRQRKKVLGRQYQEEEKKCE